MITGTTGGLTRESRTLNTTANEGTQGSLVRIHDTGSCLLQLGGFQYEYLKVSQSIRTEFFLGKDYSGAKFLYTELISLKKSSLDEMKGI